MAVLTEVGQATVTVTGPTGSPAYMTLLVGAQDDASREQVEQSVGDWWAAYAVGIAPYIIAGATMQMSRMMLWKDPTDGSILADAQIPDGPYTVEGTDEQTNLSRACGLRVGSASTERVDNRRVRGSFVVPYLGSSAINAEGAPALPGTLVFTAGLPRVDEEYRAVWASWHRPVWERDNEGNRVLVEPGQAFSGTRTRFPSFYISMLRSRRD